MPRSAWLWMGLDCLLAGDWPEEQEAYQVCILVHLWGLYWVNHGCTDQSLQVVLASQCSSGLRFSIIGQHFHIFFFLVTLSVTLQTGSEFTVVSLASSSTTVF